MSPSLCRNVVYSVIASLILSPYQALSQCRVQCHGVTMSSLCHCRYVQCQCHQLIMPLLQCHCVGYTLSQCHGSGMAYSAGVQAPWRGQGNVDRVKPLLLYILSDLHRDEPNFMTQVTLLFIRDIPPYVFFSEPLYLHPPPPQPSNLYCCKLYLLQCHI